MSDDERALEHAYRVQCPCVGRDSSEPYGYLCLDHYRMTRAEWEATIDYEAMLDRFITKAVSLDSEGWSRDFAMTQLREIVGVDAAVGQLSNRHQLVVDTNVGKETP